jgi:hypothetical protein
MSGRIQCVQQIPDYVALKHQFRRKCGCEDYPTPHNHLHHIMQSVFSVAARRKDALEEVDFECAPVR